MGRDPRAQGRRPYLAALRSIRAARPGGYRLFVIMDNLAANKTPAIRRWARRENVELCFTPTNASWANPIEAQFGPLRTFVISNSDYRNHSALARRLQDYLRWRNAHACHPRRAGRPAPRTSPHPQRRPATLGPRETESCLTRPVNVRGQRTRFGARVEDEGVVDPFFGVPVLGPKQAGSSVSVYWPLLAR